MDICNGLYPLVVGNEIMTKTILILLSIIFAQFCVAQDESTVCRNNEYIIKLIEYDSIYSIFEVERYHGISYYFGEVSFSNDTMFFREVDDTFFLLSPKIFLDYDRKIPQDSIEIETNLTFWRGDWEWPYSTHYIMNDTIHQFVPGYSDPTVRYIGPYLGNTSDSISLIVESKGYFRSKKFVIDLRKTPFYKNFRVQDIVFERFNRVILKADIMGSQQLPGRNFKSLAPSKISINGKEYILINI